MNPDAPPASEPSTTGRVPGGQEGPGESGRLWTSALLLAALGFLAFVLSVVWQLVIAHSFGTSADLDAFWVGLALPKAVVESFHMGILTVVFILIFNRPGASASRSAEWRLASSFVNAVLGATLVGIPILVLGAPFLVRLMAPGLDPESLATAGRVLQLTSLMLIPTALTGAIAGILHARKEYLPFAAARVAGLSVQILVLVLVSRASGVHGIGWGLLAGAVAMLVACASSLRRTGFRYAPTLGFAAAGATDVTAVFATFAAFSFLDRVNQMAGRFFASLLGPGAVSAFEFGWRFEIPVSTILSMSVALPSLAVMANQASAKRLLDLRRTVATGLTLIAWLVFPAIGFMVVFRESLTVLWLQRGAFSAIDSREVASLIPALAVSFAMRALGTITVFGLLAVRRLRALIAILTLEVVANAALISLLVGPWGLQGIVVATATTMLGSGVALAVVLLRQLEGWSPREFAQSVARPLLATATSVGLLAVSHRLLAPPGSSTMGGLVGQLLAFGSAFLVAHLFVGRALGLVETGRRAGGPWLRFREPPV